MSGPATFEVSPHKLVYGGEALGHYAGRTILVERALAGERLEVETMRDAKGVIHARPLKVLEAAPERVEPRCPYFGRCGGCHYQHLSGERQAVAKREILRETLRRLGKIDWAGDIPVHAAAPWSYRNQVELKVSRDPAGAAVIGFFAAESHRVVPIDSCAVASPLLNAILAELRRDSWSKRLAGVAAIELLADDRDERALLTLHGDALLPTGAGSDDLARECLAGLPGVAGVALALPHQAPRVWGSKGLDYRVGEFNYHISPGSFFQVSRFLLPQLVAAVAGDSAPSGAAPPGGFALDLFAGVGLFTLPLARRFELVTAVESCASSASDLAANAAAHGLNNIRVTRASASDFLRRFARTEPGLVVLDPPRSGVSAAALKLLVNLRPRRLHYLSCSPPTLARDLGCLTSLGYRLESLELFELFPQTYHIESLARLDRP